MTFTIFGHRRSGNNFLKKCIDSNFVCGKTHVSHKIFNDSFVNVNGIFIVRDGRDVLTSCYYWWKGCKGSRKNFKDKTFSQYINGEDSVSARQMGLSNRFEKMFTDPVGFWVEYNELWFGRKFTVKFEDLKMDQLKVLQSVEKEFNFERRNNSFKTINKLVGYSPRKGIIGDWRRHFSKEDENLFWSKAESIMHKLGYEK